MTNADPTFRLLYRSRVRIPSEERKAELGSIFSAARSNNKRQGVTGALLVWRSYFVQALEGDEETVRALYDHIYVDARHDRVTLLEAGPVEGRAFERWSMARVSEDGEPDIPLLMDRDKGGITIRARRPSEAEENDEAALLETMREYARAEETPA